MRKSNKQKPKETLFYAIITEDEKSSFLYIQKLLSLLNDNFREKNNKSRIIKKHFTHTLEAGNHVLVFDIIHDGSCPSNIKTKAQELIKNKSTQYRQIFCVFDKDSHNNKGKHGEKNAYNDLKHYCTTRSDLLVDASSVPSFEYFLYLHFKYHDAPVVGEGKDSASDVMEKMVQQELPTYTKGTLNFGDFKDKIQTAVTNSQKSIARYNNDNNDNPLTFMGKMHDTLKEIVSSP